MFLSTLSRTPLGIRNIHLFYPNQYLVIVEGEDDKPFWSKIFPREVNGYKLNFQAVGGWGKINNYLKQIFRINACFIVDWTGITDCQ